MARKSIDKETLFTLLDKIYKKDKFISSTKLHLIIEKDYEIANQTLRSYCRYFKKTHPDLFVHEQKKPIKTKNVLDWSLHYLKGDLIAKSIS